MRTSKNLKTRPQINADFSEIYTVQMNVCIPYTVKKRFKDLCAEMRVPIYAAVADAMTKWSNQQEGEDNA